jgi:integrase
LRITAAGDRSFSVRVRIGRKLQPVRLTFDKPAHVDTLTDARAWARKVYDQARLGVDPRGEKRAQEAARAVQEQQDERNLFENVAKTFLATNGVFKKNARGWKPRTYAEYERITNKRLVPKWKGRSVHSITRDEVSDFLAEVAEDTPVAANRALAALSTMFSWYQTHRGSKFTSPIVRGMAPTEETARDRILADDELRLVWRVAGRAGVYGGIVRELLLTAARKGEIANMRRSHIGRDGIWGLPGEFVKNHVPLFLPLSQEALDVIAAQDVVDDQDLVFSIGGKTTFQNWGHAKVVFDRRVLRLQRAIARKNGDDPAKVKAIPHWTLHDLRRTAKSLMSRAKVRPDHSERVLNHVIPGVEGTYDRHSYEDEKRDALERLAAIVRQITRGELAKVVSFPSRMAVR